LLPTGFPGELYLGGRIVAEGYLNRDVLTARCFVDDLYGLEPGARCFRSGDLATRRADGRIEFGGRADDQLKVRGIRIEPGEIRAALLVVPGVSDAAVAVHPQRPDTLVAYCTGDAARAADWRSVISERLPSSVVPAQVVWLEDLPRTSTGKVDTKALPAPSEPASRMPGPHGAGGGPETATERAVAGLWAELIGAAPDGIGVTTGLLELGGSSLSLIQLRARLRDEFAIDLPMVELFRHPTVRALSAAIDALRVVK
jgi:acyl carrier protein